MDHLVSNKHIAIFVPTLHPGGAEMVALNLARGFADRKFRVDVLVVDDSGDLRDLLPPGVRLLKLGGGRVITALPGLVKYLRAETPWYVISIMDHTNVVAIWGRALARSPTKVAATIHTLLSTEARHGTRLREKLSPYAMRWFLRRADRVFAASASLADDVELVTGLSRDKINVISNPVLTEDFKRQMQSDPDHPWFAEGEPPVIISVGRLTGSKDFTTLVRAFAKVREVRRCRLMILGEGADRNNIETIVTQLGVTADVALPGYVTNPGAYMSRAALFALSSKWEAFGNVIVEALMCGLSVVSTDSDGPREILENGRYGRLVPVGDVDGLSQSIAKALSEPSKRPSSEFFKRFEIDTVIDNYIDIML